MLPIDLTGKRALVAGVADDGGFGFAISKALASAGATVCVGTWPPALGIFETLLRRGKLDASLALPGGGQLEFERIYPLDAEYDTLEDVPAEVLEQKRYRDRGDVSIDGMVQRIREDFGDGCLDIVVHSLANGPEVKKPLLETSRRGYLAALGASAYSFVSLVQRVQPLMREESSYLALSYLASQGVVADYGGGMASAKAALETDARMLSFELGRKAGHRVNVISAGPYASRAATAIGFIDKMIKYYTLNAPLQDPLRGEEVGNTAAFLCSPLASGITGTVVYVDKGYHAMAAPADVEGSVDAMEGDTL
ncbi:MAG: enoyl-[acyl-carrier-protein] reductase [Polyangiales bacterium]